MAVNQKSERIIEMEVQTELSRVEQVAGEIAAFAAEHGLQEEENIKVIARELFLNAVDHGNCNDPQKTIRCTAELLEPAGIKITVTDEGDGFNYEKFRQEIYTGGSSREQGGLALLYTLSDLILFNEKGNSVSVIYHPSVIPEEEIEIQYETGFIKIIPRVELTAAVAGDFRNMLVKMFDKGCRHFLLDFKFVNQIDSLCIAVMLSFAKMIGDEGKSYKLEISDLSADLYMLLTMMGFSSFYTLEKTGEQAE